MRTAAVAAALACASLGAAGQTLYKCVVQGKTGYQAEPCPDAAKQGTLKAPPAGPAKAAAGKDGAAKEPPPSDLDAAIDVIAGYRACADSIHEWEGAHRTAYEQWRTRNGATVSRVETDADAQRKYLEKAQAFRAGSSRTCANVLAVIKPGDTEFMKGVRPNLSTKP